MNLLSKSEVFAENKLFATLDTTVRKVVVENLPFLLADTVGFIRKLPTDLVDSFKSTLDETREADLLLHVVDISHPDFEEQIQAALEEHGVELVVLAGFLSILSADFTSRWQKRIINVHPALIPSFCGEGYYGLRVHEAALARGVKITGATVHFVNEIPDGGEIILQKAVSVYKNDTPEILQRRVMERAEWIILPKAAEIVSKKILTEGENYGK